MNEKEARFVAHLWRQDRKGFAELRRSLNEPPGTSVAAIPYVERFSLGEANWTRQMYYLLAGLFCLVERPLEPRATPPEPFGKNLGESMARLYLINEKSGSTEARFVRLLDADAERLADRLRQTVTLLRSEQVPIGWEVLLTDLRHWRNENRFVQHRWARSFYLKAEADSTEAPRSGGDE